MLSAEIKRYHNSKDRQILLCIDVAFQSKNTENRRKENCNNRLYT